MNIIRLKLCVATGLIVFSSCDSSLPCSGADEAKPVVHSASTPAAMDPTGDPFAPGPIEIVVTDVTWCVGDVSVPIRVYSPRSSGEFPVIQFQHGFQTRNSDYDSILQHVASHGFVIIAPQMYEPGVGSLFNGPTVLEEAAVAAGLVEDTTSIVQAHTVVQRTDAETGLIGHSRGGKVAWQVAVNHPDSVKALAGIDPVDGRGGPMMNQPRLIQGSFDFQIASFVLGAGLGGDCAPIGDNHEQFFAASPMPAWHVVATEYGHADMLDEDAAGFASLVCESNSNREPMRRLTAGMLVAFFRGTMQGGDTQAAFAYISAESAPANVMVETNFEGEPQVP